jgi:hypothetical protein
MVLSVAGPLFFGTTNGALPMTGLKRIAVIGSIIALLGLSGCFWGRGGWGGHGDHGDHYGDRGAEHHDH